MKAAAHDAEKDKNQPRRPIIFIGHSFGGIVIEQAIVHAGSARRGQEPSLLDFLAGVIFLGTPHAGSDMAKFGVVAAKTAQLLSRGQTQLLLDVETGSWKIWDMVATFVKIVNDIQLRNDDAVICYFENRPTDYSRRISTSSLAKLFAGLASGIVSVDSRLFALCIEHHR